MNELQKAQKYVTDKNNSLPTVSKLTGIPTGTLTGYRANPGKLKTAAWIRVHDLAALYDNKHLKEND